MGFIPSTVKKLTNQTSITLLFVSIETCFDNLCILLGAIKLRLLLFYIFIFINQSELWVSIHRQ